MMNRSSNGFTIVELLIAMVVGVIIMTAIYAMVNLSQGQSAGVGRRVATQQDSRAVLDLMAMEVSMVSFNPNMLNATWSNNDCNCVNTNPSRKGIQVANTSQIGLAMDIGGLISGTANVPSGRICDSPNEYIRYTYNAANNTITRMTNCGNDEVILGGTGSSTMVKNNDAGTPLFQYFNVSGSDISTTVINTPDVAVGLNGIKDIKRIRINIIADDPVADPQGGSARVSRRTYSTDVLVRNHAMAQ